MALSKSDFPATTRWASTLSGNNSIASGSIRLLIVFSWFMHAAHTWAVLLTGRPAKTSLSVHVTGVVMTAKQ